jgi:hemerythrin-like domain-containing protein
MGGRVQKAIEVLMGEHRLIEQALGSLETYGGLVRGGAPAEREVVGGYAAFFRGFADTCHHGKEEDILFRRMVARGFPQQAGPLAVMLHEHELGRRHVAGLHALSEGPGALTAPEASVLLGHADAYVPLLRQHIQKEDLILYPLALQVLDGGELDAMNTAFEAFEARLEADGSADRLRSLLEHLTARFRPDPARMAEGSRLSCGMPGR